jgi:hypothetical protein
MAGWEFHVVDVQGAFLNGEFEDGEQIYMTVPDGFERYYDPKKYVLLLRRTLYGLIQAALAFWRKLVLAFLQMEFKRSKADPCLFYKWTDAGLVLWVVIVDDCLGTGPTEELKKAKAELMQIFACDDQGEMTEYIGCKIDYNKNDRYMKILQPVLIQSFEDEFGVSSGEPIATPAVPGTVLTKGEIDTDPHQQFLYRSGVGKLIHAAKWSRVDCLNAIRELSRHTASGNSTHITAMKRCMAHMLQTKERGLLIKPKTTWDGSKNHVFTIEGGSDSTYASCPDTRMSVSGTAVFLEGAPIECKSNMQKWVTLSVTEAEIVAATSCAQSMLFEFRLLRSIGLDVKLPMELRVDNSGAKDFFNNWSIGGRMRHVHVRQLYLRDLKEDGLVRVKWIPTEENSVDVFTKNLFGPLYEKHIKTYVGTDQYMQYEGTDWKLVAQKKKRKAESGHGSSRGSGHGFDRGSARGEGVGDELGATGTLARGTRRTTPIQKSKVKFSTETK